MRSMTAAPMPRAARWWAYARAIVLLPLAIEPLIKISVAALWRRAAELIRVR